MQPTNTQLWPVYQAARRFAAVALATVLFGLFLINALGTSSDNASSLYDDRGDDGDRGAMVAHQRPCRRPSMPAPDAS